MSDGKTGLQLRSLIKKSGELEISLVDVPTPEPAADEVVVRVEAAPMAAPSASGFPTLSRSCARRSAGRSRSRCPR